jgi:hypothetical protein
MLASFEGQEGLAAALAARQVAHMGQQAEAAGVGQQ